MFAVNDTQLARFHLDDTGINKLQGRDTQTTSIKGETSRNRISLSFAAEPSRDAILNPESAEQAKKKRNHGMKRPLERIC